jgi:hypothetical protein
MIFWVVFRGILPDVFPTFSPTLLGGVPSTPCLMALRYSGEKGNPSQRSFGL